MNAHIPQSYEAATELEELAAVPHQLITPRDAKPIIGIVQDTLVGVYRITRPNNSFNKREFMNMMMWNRRFDGTLPKESEAGGYTGQNVVSALLPPVNLEMQNGSENMVRIREGEVLEGVMDKGIFAKPSKGIIHASYNDYGPQTTVDLIDNLQNTMENYLVLNGFSVGISDLIADDQTKGRMEVEIQKRKKEIGDIMLQVHLDLFDNNTGQTNQQAFEDRVFKVLNQATDEAGKIGQSSLADENRMTAMVRAGSKGGPINIAQMMACVGQQNIEGKRIPYGFTDRTLPHYKKYDDGPEARGFVESSFIRGLTPQEFFFHSMSGREGLIDTAVKTADTGYIQRQMVKAMEDLVVQHDGTVRDANMGIVQFHYGEDGVNATKIESHAYPLGKLTEADIEREFGMQGVDFTAVLVDGVEYSADAAAVGRYVKQVLADQKMLVEGVFGSMHQGAVYSPVNIERLLLNLRIRFGIAPTERTDLTPSYVLEGIEKIIARTQPFNTIWCALLRFMLAPHKMVIKERFTRAAFDTACEMLIIKNWQSWVQPGEQVGILAAQSIGEPSTQMSNRKDTVITVHFDPKNKNTVPGFSGKVCEFIDPLLEKYKDDVITIGKDSVVLDLKDDYYIMGVSDNEKTSWKRISQISRHPANGGLVEVVTKSGRKTTATLTHSFLKRSTNGIVPVLGSDLKVGDRVPIAREIPQVPNPLNTFTQGTTTFTLDKEFGWVCGIYLADGSLNGQYVKICKIAPIVEDKLRTFAAKYNVEVTVKTYQGEYGPGKDTLLYSKDLVDFLRTTFKTGSYDKEVGGLVYHSNVEFIHGVVGGYFDGDGNINVERHQIRAGSRSASLIRHVNRLLGYCGIFGVLGQETSVNIPGKTMYTLNILKKYAAVFKKVVGLSLPDKAAGLDQIIEYINRDDKHDTKELYDKIPELGEVIAETGRLLNMPGQSRTYGRWAKKESVGRLTLAQYVQDFKDMMAIHVKKEVREFVNENIAILESALDADIVWDSIVELNYLDDPKEFVYDFTVPGNDSFMVDDNILVHNTLNTFHLAGVASKSNVTRGVPRLKELLKVTKNPKAISLTAPMRQEFALNKEKAREVAQDLELTLLKDITTRAAIYYDPHDDATVLKEDRELLEFYKAFEQSVETEEEEDESGQAKKWSPWLLRIELDREKMFNKNISMSDVAFVLKNYFMDEVHLVYSDYNDKRLVMRIRLSLESLAGTSVMDDLMHFKKLQNKLLTGIVIRGIPGIISAAFKKDADHFSKIDGSYKVREQYVIETDGSNFLEVMNHNALDGSRIYTTHPHDVFDVLGVEAARAVLLNEMTQLFNEVGLNYRHLGLLCDMMTHAGRFMSIDRHGINKSNIGPLAKASFEETAKILLKASLFGEMDPVTGVSSNIMMGQTIRGGTSFSQIILDEAALPRLLEGLPIDEGEEDDEEMESDVAARLLVEDVDDPCAVSHFHMNVTMPSAPLAVLDEPDVEADIYDE